MVQPERNPLVIESSLMMTSELGGSPAGLTVLSYHLRDPEVVTMTLKSIGDDSPDLSYQFSRDFLRSGARDYAEEGPFMARPWRPGVSLRGDDQPEAPSHLVLTVPLEETPGITLTLPLQLVRAFLSRVFTEVPDWRKDELISDRVDFELGSLLTRYTTHLYAEVVPTEELSEIMILPHAPTLEEEGELPSQPTIFKANPARPHEVIVEFHRPDGTIDTRRLSRRVLSDGLLGDSGPETPLRFRQPLGQRGDKLVFITDYEHPSGHPQTYMIPRTRLEQIVTDFDELCPPQLVELEQALSEAAKR